MPNALQELIKKLTGSRDGSLPALQDFQALNIEQIAGDLQIEERATEYGSRNQPSQESTAEDVIESDIRHHIDGRARKAQEEYQAQIKLYDDRIRRVQFSADLQAEITMIGEMALGDFKRVAINDRDYLNNARREVEGAEKELEAFRQVNKLKRMSKVISPQEKTIRISFVIILIIFESIINGTFFAKGTEFGLIGGFLEAILFSILNVGVAVLIATKATPYINHVKNNLKLMGYMALTFYVLWLLGFNLYIGHFRDQFVQMTGQVTTKDIMQRIINSPFGFVEARSFVLFLLGMLLNIAAFFDSRGLEDQYPGYGSVGRRSHEAAKSYVKQKESCLAELTGHRNKAINDIQSVLNLRKDAEFEHRLANEGRAHLHDHFKAYIKHLDECYYSLIRRYHEANIRVRTEPPPCRFLTRPSRPEFIDEPTLNDLQSIAKDDREQIAEKIEYFVKTISQGYDMELEQYHSISDITVQEDIESAKQSQSK